MRYFVKMLALLCCFFAVLTTPATQANENPLLTEHPILFVSRSPDVQGTHIYVHDTMYASPGSALKLLDVKTGKTTTLLECPKGIIRNPCVHFDGKRVLFAMNPEGGMNFHIFELNTEKPSGAKEYPLKQLTFAEDVSDVDPIYLPDGDIVFASSRNLKFVPCAIQTVPQLFRMEGDGANIHQITRSLVHENQVTLMPDGRLLYSRWDYIDRNFGDGHGFWVTNPDGTNQAIIWGNNTAHPSSGWNARAIPGTKELVCILGTHHGSLGGALTILDPTVAVDGYDSIAQTFPANLKQQFANLPPLDLEREEKSTTKAWLGGYKCFSPETLEHFKKDPNLQFHRWVDALRRVTPWYDTPFPLADGNSFLCARAPKRGRPASLWLVNRDGEETLLHSEKPGCYSPMPLAPTKRPPIIPTRRDYGEGDGYFFVQNVYEGTHMQNVKPGAVKYLRVVEAPDKDGKSSGKWHCLGGQSPGVNWSSFNCKRILGTVDVSPNGSAYFAVPSDKFVYFQLLDKDKKMIQSMRAGTSVHSGEFLGCVGCHESRTENTPAMVQGSSSRITDKPQKLQPWYGSSRRFSYVTEVQPIFDKHCVKCHDFGKKGAKKIVLSGDRTEMFNFSYDYLWAKGYVGGIGAGPAGHLPAYAWGSHVSPLIKHLEKGHQKVKLSREEWERLITWVDLNGPYYPTTLSSERGGGRSASRGTTLAFRLLKMDDRDPYRHSSRKGGPYLNFDRPELSPGLAKVEKGSPQYNDVIAEIKKNQAWMQEFPRGDTLEGFVPFVNDQRTIDHREKYRSYELKVRKAIREGRKIYDKDFDKTRSDKKP